MHDQVLVRVNDGLAHRPEKQQAFADAESARPARVGERHTLDVLHHDPGCAVLERACVVHARDRRVVELRQRSLFGREALPPAWRDPGVAEHLDRRRRAEVVALGQVHHAHPAFADHPREAIGPDAATDRARRVIQEGGREAYRITVEH